MKLAFFAVCAALVFGSLTIRQLNIHSSEVTGTVLEARPDTKNSAAAAYLTVRLESGETVKASASRKMDYRGVVLEERANNFFGVRRHEFKGTWTSPAATDFTYAQQPQPLLP